MKDNKQIARELLKRFKGKNYIFGNGCLTDLGSLVGLNRENVSLVVQSLDEVWMHQPLELIKKSLADSGIKLAGNIISGAEPNAPREDVYRIAKSLAEQKPSIIINVGSGSSIDATKAASAFKVLKDKFPDLDDYFGMNTVTGMLESTGFKLPEMIAVQWASSSAAHLTKYSNITDIASGQKMLIVDNALVPGKALFDYSVTKSQPGSLTRDGGLDGMSHCLEVLMGIPEEKLELVHEICLTGIELIVQNLKTVCENPSDEDAREAIGLGTDLGGYSIMIGGTNGAHLNSFSMTDILSHGRACALMNPYYVVFFSPKIEQKLRSVAQIFKRNGYLKDEFEHLHGRELGLAVAGAMLNLSNDVGFPTTLNDVKGFTDHHIQMCLKAAKDPKLESKLKNMPVPLTSEMVDEYMGAILEAAKTGNFSLIKNV